MHLQNLGNTVMEQEQTKVDWWSITSVRVSHPILEPDEVSKLLGVSPQIAMRPGESRVPYRECLSAGYWCLQHRTDAPDRPDVALLWAEEFIRLRETQLYQLLKQEVHINVYVA